MGAPRLSYGSLRLPRLVKAALYHTCRHTLCAGVGGQLRRLARLGRASAAPQMVLLDLANGGYVKHEGEVDERAIERLVDEYVAGRLELTTAK